MSRSFTAFPELGWLIASFENANRSSPFSETRLFRITWTGKLVYDIVVLANLGSCCG
jgi:hypothetical protein